MFIVSLYLCYFEQENILIGAWEGEIRKQNHLINKCVNGERNACYIDSDLKVNIL